MLGEGNSALLMQRATASRALQSYIFLRDMEKEGRSKVTVSDEDTEPLRTDCSTAKVNNWLWKWQGRLKKKPYKNVGEMWNFIYVKPLLLLMNKDSNRSIRRYFNGH